MIRGRRGQTVIEAVVVAPILMTLLIAGGTCGLVPLAVFFVEDRMDEALICMTSDRPFRCHLRFEAQVRKGLVRRWIKRTNYVCDRSECRIRVSWAWPEPFPQTTERAYFRRVRVALATGETR